MSGRVPHTASKQKPFRLLMRGFYRPETHLMPLQSPNQQCQSEGIIVQCTMVSVLPLSTLFLNKDTVWKSVC